MAVNMLRILTGGKRKTINLTTDLGMQMLNGVPEDIDYDEFMEHARLEWIDVSWSGVSLFPPPPPNHPPNPHACSLPNPCTRRLP